MISPNTKVIVFEVWILFFSLLILVHKAAKNNCSLPSSYPFHEFCSNLVKTGSTKGSSKSWLITLCSIQNFIYILYQSPIKFPFLNNKMDKQLLLLNSIILLKNWNFSNKLKFCLFSASNQRDWLWKEQVQKWFWPFSRMSA